MKRGEKQVVIIKELEKYFNKYPYVPKEVIIKEDCLRHGLSWTAASINAAEGHQLKSYYLFQFDRSARGNMQLGEPVRAPEEIKVFGGDYQLKETVIANHLSTNSPYLVDIDKVDGKLKLFDRSDSNTVRQIAEVRLRRPPKYYSMNFKDGRPYWDIAPTTGWGHIMFITVLRMCQYWGDKEECKFCDLNANAREQKGLGRPHTIHKSVADVVEAAKAAWLEYFKANPVDSGEYESVWEMVPHTLQLSGGTVTKQVSKMDDSDFYLQYVEALKEAIGSRFPIMLQQAAKDKETCKKLKAAGVDIHICNFEVWDKRLFKIICPGKERFVGRDEWIKRLVESVEVFGEGNVHPGFVAGVEMAQPWGFKTVDEAIASTTEGFEFLMSHGVVPRPITWCIEPLSALGGHPMIPLEYYIRIAQAWYATRKKYGVPVHGHGPMETGRGRYPNNAYCDMPGC